MSRKPPEAPIVHIHPPRFPNDPVEIIGNPKGLERLINALIEAVSVGSGCGVVRTSDGHPSEVRAICLQGKRRPEEWNRSGSPYWDIDDSLVAKLLELTEENRTLRQWVASLRKERRSTRMIDACGKSGEADDGLSSAI